MEQDNQLPLWEVFIQKNNGLPFKHEGSIHASDAAMALQNARDIYTRRGEGRTIWVVPSSAIAATTVEDEAEFFDPSDDKIYRHPTFYVMPEGAKQI
ncbi:MAG: 1,2-phenylacetyl-CoA epoxidase subunit B [Chitinophagaceae bacterium]|nr:1,2-phenylacetyl-CoA epoxidase subunit B [Chitinophagaceae bacterium]